MWLLFRRLSTTSSYRRRSKSWLRRSAAWAPFFFLRSHRHRLAIVECPKPVTSNQWVFDWANDVPCTSPQQINLTSIRPGEVVDESTSSNHVPLETHCVSKITPNTRFEISFLFTFYPLGRSLFAIFHLLRSPFSCNLHALQSREINICSRIFIYRLSDDETANGTQNRDGSGQKVSEWFRVPSAHCIAIECQVFFVRISSSVPPFLYILICIAECVEKKKENTSIDCIYCV